MGEAKDIEELILYQDKMRYTGLEFVHSSIHGEGINFIQSFPHPFLIHTIESVFVKISDIPKVIDYLQSALEYVGSNNQESE